MGPHGCISYFPRAEVVRSPGYDGVQTMSTVSAFWATGGAGAKSALAKSSNPLKGRLRRSLGAWGGGGALATLLWEQTTPLTPGQPSERAGPLPLASPSWESARQRTRPSAPSGCCSGSPSTYKVMFTKGHTALSLRGEAAAADEESCPGAAGTGTAGTPPASFSLAPRTGTPL